MVVRPGFLTSLLEPFDDPRVFAVCADIQIADGVTVQTGAPRGTFTGLLRLDYDEPTVLRPVLYAGGGCSAYHRAKWDYLGGFDPAYRPFYWEDVDIGFRAWRAGWLSLNQPRASVTHKHRATIASFYSPGTVERVFAANAIYFCWKNLRSWALLARHFAYLAGRLVSSLASGDTRPARAFLSVLPRLPRAIRARVGTHLQGGPSDLDILRRAQGRYDG